jgi:hypothetical protein
MHGLITLCANAHSATRIGIFPQTFCLSLLALRRVNPISTAICMRDA